MFPAAAGGAGAGVGAAVDSAAGIASVLKWEGILIDPVGAVLAVLVFEGIIDQTGVGPAIVGIARKNENSAEARLSAPSSIAPTMVEPDRDTPGIIARHWHNPILKASDGGKSIAS